MANEIQLSSSISYSKNGITSFTRSVANLSVTQTGNGGVYEPGFTINNADTTLNLGGVTTLGRAWFHNLDAMNTINIKTAAGGTIIISIPPGEYADFRFGSGITAPVAISSAGTPLLEYEILQN